MDWLSFLIGALVGWLIGWLIDYLFCRRRRMAAAALLNAKLEQCNEESAALRAQVSGYQDVQVRLDAANAAIGTLKTQVAGMKDLQVRLDGANSQALGLQAQVDGIKDLQVRLGDADVELDSLRAQVGGMKDLQVRLDGANTEIDSLKAQLARMKGVQADLVDWKARATEQGIEIERLNAELAARVSAGTAGAVAAAGAVTVADAAVHAGTLEAGVDTSAIPAPETGIAVTPTVAQAGEPDDLTVIEGIGPKINALFNQNGLYTFAQLAAATVDRLRSILSSGGPRFRMADPQTWPEQALLARDGKWDALTALQDTLKGGRKV